MSFISTAIVVFQFLVKVAPLIEQLVRMAEATFTMPQQGSSKLEYVISEVKMAYQAEQTLSSSLAWEALVPFLGRNIAVKVKTLFPAPSAPLAVPQPAPQVS